MHIAIHYLAGATRYIYKWFCPRQIIWIDPITLIRLKMLTKGEFYFNFRFHQSENPKIFLSNADLPKVRQFEVNAVHDYNGQIVASNNVVFHETEQKYRIDLGNENHFEFQIFVGLIFRNIIPDSRWWRFLEIIFHADIVMEIRKEIFLVYWSAWVNFFLIICLLIISRSGIHMLKMRITIAYESIRTLINKFLIHFNYLCFRRKLSLPDIL